MSSALGARQAVVPECQSQTRPEADKAQLAGKEEEGTVEAALPSAQKQDSKERGSTFRCLQTVGKRFQSRQQLSWAGRKNPGEKLPVLR